MGYGAMSGIPMVASSPVRHDSPLMHGLEVTAYQPPWKALSDFALNADLDNNGAVNTHTPAFQHLVNQVSRGEEGWIDGTYCDQCFVLFPQMHGYDMNSVGGMPQPPPSQVSQMQPLESGGHNHQPDSTDSYVTYLESDDSMQASP